MTTPRATACLLVAVLVILPSCSHGRSSAKQDPQEPVRLTMSGGCGDAFMWAATPKGDLAVTVSVEARDRAADEPTKIDLDLPDPAITVEVLRGNDLAHNFCNDVILASSRPSESLGVTAGTGSLVLDPSPDPGAYTNCGQVSGRLRLRGLVADDGTTIAPIDATTDQIGCYAG